MSPERITSAVYPIRMAGASGGGAHHDAGDGARHVRAVAGPLHVVADAVAEERESDRGAVAHDVRPEVAVAVAEDPDRDLLAAGGGDGDLGPWRRDAGLGQQ